MKYAQHNDRKTLFTKTIEQSGRIHALIEKGKPWRNGFIERSNRTDKEELFNINRFVSSEERKYQLKLWEYHYNFDRPHQGIGNKTPQQILAKKYPIHAKVLNTT